MKTRAAVIGGGITGLAAATWLRHDHGVEDVVVLEATARPGGKMRTEIDAGYTLEWGPQGFLDNAPDTLDLAVTSGLEEDLVRADNAAADRFILRDGVLRRVSTSPIGFLASDILPLAGRLRLLGEPFARKRPDHDETIFDFASRRIGQRAAEVLVDAMVTGVFAGDSKQLSLAATFPRMAAMEADHGSLTAAMLAKMREARKTGKRSGGPSGPGGTLSTFRNGMQQLPDRLAKNLGDCFCCNQTARTVRKEKAGFAIDLGGEELIAEEVLLTLPATGATSLLKDLTPEAVEPLQGIPTVPIAVVMLGYDNTDAFAQPVGGFGFLVPRGEEPGILGTLYCHDIFPSQAPEGSLFLRVMLGGARSPELPQLDDKSLLVHVRRALAGVFGTDPGPDRLWIVRWEHGISQYTVGHLQRVAAAEKAAGSVGIELAGSPYRGVSVNDCIKQARAAASRIAQRLGS